MAAKKAIIEAATDCLARKGYEGSSMRDVAAAADVHTSAIYYYFSDKAELFEAVYMQIIKNLQRDIAPIRVITDPSERLRAILTYQFTKRKMLAALLNYFVGQSDKFPRRSDDGYVPAGAYMHIIECLKLGEALGIYRSHTSGFDAKIIAHIMNGFILEYAHRPLNRDQCATLVTAIASFIEAATTQQERMPE